MYRHIQIGLPMLVLNAAIVLGLAVAVVRGGGLLIILALAVVLLVSALFSTLTVEVTDQELRFRFGPGGWGKAIPLREIAAVAPSRSSWLEGVGIRFTRRGMLYNVAVGPAVEITPHSGQAFRVGSDEPERLVAAIESRLGPR